MLMWNLWHRCHKISPGCKHCYVYRQDAKYEKSSNIVTRTQSFDLPLRKNRKGEYKIPPGETVYTCLTSDFFVEGADDWRVEAWEIIKKRLDLKFRIFTKRTDRFCVGLPSDWGDGYENVEILCTAENQDRADYRLPIFTKLPINQFVVSLF